MTLVDIQKHYSHTCENNKLTVSLAASIAPLSLSGQPLRRIPKIQQNHIIFVFLKWNGRTGKSRTPFSCSNDFLRPNSQEVSNLEPLISGKWRALRKWHFEYNTFTRKCIFGAKCPGGHLEGFEACLQRSPALRTRARNSFVFQGKSKICTTIFTKSTVF